MSQFATIDGQELGQVATNSGWYDFTNWIEEIQGIDALRHVAEYGWYEGNLLDVASNLVAVVRDGEPSPDQKSIAVGLYRMLKDRGNANGVLVISDGTGEGGDEDVMTLANAEPAPPARIPTQEELLASALAEADQLFTQLYSVLLRLRTAEPWHRETLQRELSQTVEGIRQLDADARTAARVLGMVSPWMPELTDAPLGAPQQQPVPLALSLGAIDDPINPVDRGRFPWLTRAVDFLLGKQVVTWDRFRVLAREDKAAVFHAPGVNDERLLNDLKVEVAASAESGESLEDFRKRMSDTLQLRQDQTNTLFRTNTKQSYVDGMQASLDSPTIAEAFPFVQLASTHDTRTRPEHREMDGFVARRGTPEYNVLMRLVKDWNCRCAIIPLTAADAEQRGIKTFADIPSSVVALYG